MKVIYVDDEVLLLENFRLTAEELGKIDSLETFSRSEDALEWAKNNPVDVAFLDIEMPVINGIELAKRLKAIDENIRIIFVTAFEQYALQAFGVNAIGYLLKPYSAEDIEKELKKASNIKRIPKAEIQIYTMPDFAVTVGGKPLKLGQTKQEELLALLVDRGETGITKEDVINCLWFGYSGDSVYWTTMSRLKAALDEAGIADLILSSGQRKFINMEMADCDLYRMLAGDTAVIERYSGEYMTRFVWAKERRKQLDAIKMKSRQ
ncbi:MAG: response regulator [Lachnospiraceae bacterium]